MAELKKKPRRRLRIVPTSVTDRKFGVELLQHVVKRLRSGETEGVIVIEAVAGDTRNYRLGWSSIRNHFELLGYLEELKHQLLLEHQESE